jgi:hypothetical protein
MGTNRIAFGELFYWNSIIPAAQVRSAPSKFSEARQKQ